jgi:hypothetical protein
MPDEATEGTATGSALRTLADKVNWLIGLRTSGDRHLWSWRSVWE